MTGFELMTEEQRKEWADLAERAAHGDTMRFTGIDAVTLAEYEALADRLAHEARIAATL